MRRRGAFLGGSLVAALVAGACGGGDGAPAGGAPTIVIEEPEDGAEVASDFTMEFSSSVELGTMESGAHHVHVVVDGDPDDYDIVESDSFEMAGLSEGDHTVTASLRTPDHSAAGAEDEISITVTTPGSGDDGGGGGTGGYDY